MAEARCVIKTRYEVQISDDSNWGQFDVICKRIISDFNGTLVSSLDGIDHRYRDFKIDGHIITLHLEHYLGISIYSEHPIDAIQLIDGIAEEIKCNDK